MEPLCMMSWLTTIQDSIGVFFLLGDCGRFLGNYWLFVLEKITES